MYASLMSRPDLVIMLLQKLSVIGTFYIDMFL
jgi:hypothetical protein